MIFIILATYDNIVKIAPEVYKIRELHKIHPSKNIFSGLKKIYFCCEILSIYEGIIDKKLFICIENLKENLPKPSRNLSKTIKMSQNC